jgi:prepilin-type N-terminal cleavage/methylation domain-containing protein
MIQRLRNRQGGFTLIELLIVVAIIGIIAALLIPNFLDALQKAKQKRTAADERNVGTAQMSWLTDMSQAGAAGASTNPEYDLTDLEDIDDVEWEAVLVPQYIQDVPGADGWKNPFHYYQNTDSAAAFGAKQLFAVASWGSDGVDDLGQGKIPTSAFDPTDYVQDILWADGFFVRWPQKLTKYN